VIQEKKLTLCVITKNDEAFLPDCLNSMKGTADELVVVDLGSSDRTVQLAKQVGATVYQPKWENDFSKIKNFCMEHANGKWVLFLQADEIIPEEQKSELRFLLKNPNAEGYLIYADNHQAEWSIFSPAQFVRLLRNRKEYRFRFRSFPYIPDETLYSLCNCNLHIMYLDKKSVGWKLDEQIQLLEEDLKEHPEDGYLQYMKGIELLNQGKVQESIAPFKITQKAVDGVRLYTPHFYKLFGISLLSQNRYEDSEKVLSEGINLAPFYNDLFILRAVLYHQTGQNQKALEDLKTCRALRKSPNPYVPYPEIDNSIIQQMQEEIQNSRK
jgi:glycosyltransferase involved in cell wall biosynthesis